MDWLTRDITRREIDMSKHMKPEKTPEKSKSDPETEPDNGMGVPNRDINELTLIEEEYHTMMTSLHTMSKQISTLANNLSSLYAKTNKVLKRVEGTVPDVPLYNEYHPNSMKKTGDAEVERFSVSNAFLKMSKSKSKSETTQTSFTKLEIMDVIHTYIKKQSLNIDPVTRTISCDHTLTDMFKIDSIPYFDLSSLIDTHVIS